MPPPDDMSGGLRAALGAGGAGGPGQSSVLRLLQGKTGSRLGLHLHAAEDSSDPPVRIDDEARALRDPSGRYQVLGEIGRGGVGVVYKGRDQDLGRDVAMKVLRSEYVDHPEILERFVEEAQIGGQLQHPGIVPVYELGLQHGERPYFAMKLVKGETLAALLARRADPSEDRRRFLGIFERVCQTLAYAHARRVVHRDLKPANVMLGSFGEVQVVDWGFAKVLPEGEEADEAARGSASMAASVISTLRSDPRHGTRSVVGSLLGTPAYMAPEQALGEVGHIDRRSDVFGLGAILCEILTGQPPYLEREGDLVLQASYADLQRAYERIEHSGADPALAALCKQCLSPAREKRPESAKQVAEAVSQDLSSVEERARQAQIHAAEAKVRARATVLLSAAAVLLLAVGGGGYLYLEEQAQARRDQVGEHVAAALNEANARLGEARAAGVVDLGPWTRALDAATQAAHLADDADVSDDQRARVRSLLAAVERERQRAQAEAARIAKDEAMRQRLLEVRIPTDDNARWQGYWPKEVRRRNDAFAAAFHAYLDGRDLTAMTAEEGVAALAGPIAVELATALDHWVSGRIYLVNRNEADAPDQAATARLREMARALDPDPWRNQLRAALDQEQQDRDALLRLHAEADLGSLPVVSLHQLAAALWNAGALDEARTVYEAACERFPDDFPCALELARLHLEANRLPEAASCFRIARALRPDMREVKHRLGLCLALLGEPAAAEHCFQDLARQEPSNAHWQFHLGDLRRHREDWQKAEPYYRRALELDPREARAHNGLGYVLVWQGRFVEGDPHLRRAIELDPTNAEAHNDLGIALSEQGHLEQARDSFHRALALDEELVSARTNLGNVYQKWKDFDQAIACHERAIQLAPGNSIVYHNLANALFDQGKLDDAIAAYRRAVQLNPRNFRHQHTLARALHARGDLPGAIDAYRQAIALDADNAIAHYHLGNALQQAARVEGIAFARRQQLDDAIACYRQAIALDPKLAMAHYNLGLALAALERLEEAIASYRRAIALDPQHANAHHDLGCALADQRRFDEAIASYRQAVAVDPQHALGHYNLGLALTDQGKLDEALASFRQARAIWSRKDDDLATQCLAETEARIAEVEAEAARLPDWLALARGERATASKGDFVAAADLVYRRGAYVLSTRTYDRAFAAFPELLQAYPHRYNGACAAALAGSGKGEGAGSLSDAERARLREQARAWLAAEVVRWAQDLGAGGEVAEEARRQVAHAQQDPDFGAVRGDEALSELPAAEAEGWRTLWQQIARLSEEKEEQK